MKKIRKYLVPLLYCLGITILFISPYLIKDMVNIEHDTFFHLSRIQGLAESIRNGVLIPRIYPLKNYGFGYGSPLFYCDILLYPAALLYLGGVSLSYCYVILLFIVTLISACAMFYVAEMTTSRRSAFIATILYIGCNYRITDVYVRGAFGETMAFMFLPLALYGIYQILYTEDRHIRWLVIGFSGLILTHNLTFVLGCFMFAFLILFNIPKLIRDLSIIRKILAAVLWVIGLTAFYTFPLIEQTLALDLVFEHYDAGLEFYTITWDQLLRNGTTFGMGSNNYPPEMTMLINIGMGMEILSIVALCRFTKLKPFIRHLLVIGLVCVSLTTPLIPYALLDKTLGFMQFPWRFLTIAVVCLSIVSASAFSGLKLNKIASIIMIIVLSGELLWHVYPVTERTFGITSKTTYQDLLDGKLVDPAYSATYNRIECAGGDYFHYGFYDYQDRLWAVRDDQGNILGIPDGSYDEVNFDITEPGTFIFPKTWYVGYQAYCHGEKVDTFRSPDGFAAVNAANEGTYTLRYDGTAVQKISVVLSLATILALLWKYKLTNSPGDCK